MNLKEHHPLLAVGGLALLLLITMLFIPTMPTVEGSGLTPTPPPFHTMMPEEGSRLAGPLLAGNMAHNAGIFLLDLATDEYRELNFGPGRHWMGDFSPDGCRFVFVMSDSSGENMRLYTAQLDGSDLRELLTFRDDTSAIAWNAWLPHWSPAGDPIAFVMIRDYAGTNGEIERRSHIAWVSSEGGAPGFYSSSGAEGQPIWSPAGSQLAYISFEERVPGASIEATAVPTPVGAQPGRLIREADIWIVGADGQNKRRLTTFETGSAIFPRWSPDGNVISFVYAPTGNNHQFWTIPAMGGAPSQWSITWTLVLAYDWLPDSTGLLAAIKNWQGYDDNLLWRLVLPGNMEENGIIYVDDPNATAVDFPLFSPDGSFLAFRSAYRALIHNTFTGEVRELDQVGRSNSPLVWSPAGFAGEDACR